ncbi:MAG: tryptophan synthase subunit alpha [Candidatus Neomarinimicrobiota bacterium]
MNRIVELFKRPGEKLIPYFTAGFPALETTTELVLAAERAGADMIELGIPFSDPIADGPVIQASSEVALQNHVTVTWILEQVETLRRTSEIPLAIMGYINPILNYGPQAFVSDCKQVGVDGLIVPDLPPEEATDFVSLCKSNTISPILLIAPNTPNDRILNISEIAGDLVYCVSILGITGGKMGRKEALKSYLLRVRENSVSPFVTGFGIKTRRDVITVNQLSDGAVVGTALIRRIEESDDPLTTVFNYVQELKGVA